LADVTKNSFYDVSHWLTSQDILLRHDVMGKVVTMMRRVSTKYFTSCRLVSFTMMFSKEMLSSFTTQYIAA
jgi:hypothetical protein